MKIDKLIRWTVRSGLVIVLALVGSAVMGDDPGQNRQWEKWKSLKMEEKKNLVAAYQRWKKLSSEKQKGLQQEWAQLSEQKQQKERLKQRLVRFQKLSSTEQKKLKQRFHILGKLLVEIKKNNPRRQKLRQQWRKMNFAQRLKFLRENLEKKKKHMQSVMPEQLVKNWKQVKFLKKVQYRLRLATIHRWLGRQWMIANRKLIARWLDIKGGKFTSELFQARATKLFKSLEKQLSPPEKELVLEELRPHFPGIQRLEDLPRLWQEATKKRKINLFELVKKCLKKKKKKKKKRKTKN